MKIIHSKNILIQVKNGLSPRAILTREAERVWKDGKDKNKKKLEHLERKWRNNPRPEVEGLWRGVKIGDNELERRVTDIPTNRFVHILNPARLEVETV